MTTTTLMTFLLRTPPTTRSVCLLGSWDNFTKPYEMQQDTRIGKGHWRGCHTFTNIICDGLVSSPGPARDGGLKMGGTYWYYYRLDDYVDFHNEAEPSTTRCPFLPGQPVNILNVPIHLPSAKRHRSRDSSVASQSSVDYQTMNPEDKYLNPRTPPRPKLPRLATSPAALLYPEYAQFMDSSPPSEVSERSSSHPRSLAPGRRFRLGRKPSVDLRGLTSSPSSANGIRTAFRNLVSTRPDSRGRSDERIERGHNISRSISPSRGENKWLYTARSKPNSRSSSKGSPSRTPVDNPKEIGEGPGGHGPLSRQRSRSRARDPSPLRTAYTIQNPSDVRVVDNIMALPHPRLDTLEESPTSPLCIPESQPGALTGATQSDSPVDLHGKRLPTLPNSPSSVLDEELRQMDAANKPGLDLDQLESHFSEFSIESSSPTALSLHGDSRFSAYSTDTDLASPSSMTSSSTFNNDGKLSPTPSISADQPHTLDFSILQLSPLSTSISRTHLELLPSPKPTTSPILLSASGTSPSASTPGTSLELIPSPQLAPNPIQLSAPKTLPLTTEYPIPIDVSSLCTALGHTQKPIKPNNDSPNALHLWNDLVRQCDDLPSLDSPFSMHEKSGYPTPRADQSYDQYHIYEDGQRSNGPLHIMMQDLLDELSYLGNAIVATSGSEPC